VKGHAFLGSKSINRNTNLQKIEILEFQCSLNLMFLENYWKCILLLYHFQQSWYK